MTAPTSPAVPEVTRMRVIARGAVQGVGFRPFVYRLAKELGLTGCVHNSPQGVLIEVEGTRVAVEQFQLRLAPEAPPRSSIQSCETSWLDPAGFTDFVIGASEEAGDRTALMLPDIATCADCLREITDPANRRYRYPFTNCTHCGPRFSIIEALPYDRANTAMKGFTMCAACQAEYDDPRDRRFHAQPNACPDCGPQLELWRGGICEHTDETVTRADKRSHDALPAAAHIIRCGQILAVKGLGGFHLLVDARNETAVNRLRERKHREEKPFALMVPTLAQVRAVCDLTPLEERLLCSPEAPIVLLHKTGKRQSPISKAVAPNNPNLGVMLPSNPLHHLLMAELGFPVVATSGNLSDEPICTDEHEARARLRDIADAFLVHNRPIVRHVDDSIVRVMLHRELVVRRARGYAPLPITLKNASTAAGHPFCEPKPRTPFLPPSDEVRNEVRSRPVHEKGSVLAVGAHLKNSVALAVGEQVFLSQHVGDLETEQAYSAFRHVADDLPRLYDSPPQMIAADLHPDYLSTQFALQSGVPRIIRVQHHLAHVLSCIAENEIALPALGVAWDGTGFGTDGAIWGGEFFLVSETSEERVASLRPFRLPGGDAAVKQPRRAALGLLHELRLGQDDILSRMRQTVGGMFASGELTGLEKALERGVNAPLCSSVGRLFDAVAGLVGLRPITRFEGQAAMELEFAAEAVATDAAYDFPIANGSSLPQLDWARMIEAIAADVSRGCSVGEISARFHHALVEAIVAVAKRVGCARVVLSGGCFQNRYLTERAVMRLRATGFQPYWHQRVPPNDGGIALGQVVAARRSLQS